MAKGKKDDAARPAKEEMVRVRVARLRTDGGTQARADALNQDVVDEYAEAYRANVALPPVKAVRDAEENYWVWDGHQRIAGAIKAGQKTLLVEVREGTAEDARWLATSANQGHGARRTNADKANAVRMALAMRPQMSDRAIADHCGVAQSTVSRCRQDHATTDAMHQSNTRIGKDGRTYDFTPKASPTPPPADDDGPPDEGVPPHPADLPRDPKPSPAPAAEPEPKPSPAESVRSYAAAEAAPAPAAADADVPLDLDALGVPVLDVHREVFAANARFDDLKNKVQAAVKSARSLREDAGGFHLGDAFRQLEAVRNSLRFARPYTRCPYCVGRAGVIDTACRPCHGRGWVTERVFHTATEDKKAAVLALAVGDARREDAA